RAVRPLIARGLQSNDVSPAGNIAVRGASPDGRALAGFLLSGFLLALLGAILPAWGYHRDPPEFTWAGNYFLYLALGLVAAARFAIPLMARRGLSFLMVFGCLLACAALLFLAMVSPPASNWWRALGFFALGTG